jgi:hypothetical protein
MHILALKTPSFFANFFGEKNLKILKLAPVLKSKLFSFPELAKLDLS